MVLSDLIKIFYITKFLKSNSQMLSGLVGYSYTLKVEFTHIIPCSCGAHLLFSKIMHDYEVMRWMLPATLFHYFLVNTGFVLNIY